MPAEETAGAPGSPARTEEEIVSGIIVVELGKLRKPLRVLSMAESRAWKLELVNVFGRQVAATDLRGVDDVGPLVDLASEKILELVVAYDVDGTLGGADWIRSNGTDQQIYSILRRTLELSFPFVKDVRSVLAELRALGLADLLSRAESPPESSSNGASEAGASASTAPLLTSS